MKITKKKYLYGVYGEDDGWRLHATLKGAIEDFKSLELDHILHTPRVLKLEIVEDITTKLYKKEE